MDLILLNKILVGLTFMNASDHRSITFGCPKTRPSEKFFFEVRKTFRKRSEDNYFNRFNNSLSQLNSFSNYSPQKYPCQFRREVKNFLEGEALKRFKYKRYPSGWKVFSRNFNYCNLISPLIWGLPKGCNHVWLNSILLLLLFLCRF